MADRSAQTLATPDRPVQQCRDIFLRQLECALEDLQEAKPNVHGARKQLKRARAMLRLLRPAIGDDQYRRENTVARDAARPLSKARDNEVMTEALDALIERFGEAASSLNVGPLRQSLQKGRAPATRPLPVKQLNQVKAALRQSMARAAAWKPAQGEWDCLATGLARTYRRARRALRHARTERATEDLHEWRKQTKYLWHQLQALTPLAPGPVGELADEFHLLADYLGDEHDLAVLSERVAAAGLKALVERSRGELQDKAFSLGERLYADKSKAFVNVLSKYWSEWDHRESRASRQHAAARHLTAT
jgi:CHAD domain-containing protein